MSEYSAFNPNNFFAAQKKPDALSLSVAKQCSILAAIQQSQQESTPSNITENDFIKQFFVYNICHRMLQDRIKSLVLIQPIVMKNFEDKLTAHIDTIIKNLKQRGIDENLIIQILKLDDTIATALVVLGASANYDSKTIEKALQAIPTELSEELLRDQQFEALNGYIALFQH